MMGPVLNSHRSDCNMVTAWKRGCICYVTSKLGWKAHQLRVFNGIVRFDGNLDFSKAVDW